MTMFYSGSTRGFYDSDIHGSAIPEDAVEISADDYRALLSAQSQGSVIEADANGMPVAVVPPPPTLDEVKAALCASVDAAADAAYAAIAGANPGRLNEYEWAKKEADAYQASGYTGAVPESIQSWVDGKAAEGITWTAQQACDDIISTAGSWLAARQENRRQRLVGKGSVRGASDEASAQSAADAAIANIRAIPAGAA